MKLSEKIELQRARKTALAELTAHYDRRRNEIIADWQEGRINYDQMTIEYDECVRNYNAKVETI